MTPSYIPARQSEYALWLANFAAVATASPSVYGLSGGDVTAISNANTSFQSALTVATDPATRTAPSVAAKDAARASSLATVRPYATAISASTSISDEDKLAIGVTVRNPTPTPIPAPVTQPIVSIVAASHLVQTIRFADSTTPDKRAKPPGAIGLQLWRFVGTTTPAGPSAGTFIGSITKQPFAATFQEADVAKTATYWGRWVTRTGLTGPWSLPVSMVVG